MDKRFLLMVFCISFSIMKVYSMEKKIDLRTVLENNEYMIIETINCPFRSFLGDVLSSIEFDEGTLSDTNEEGKIVNSKFKVANFNSFYQRLYEITQEISKKSFAEGFYTAQTGLYYQHNGTEFCPATDQEAIPGFVQKLFDNPKNNHIKKTTTSWPSFFTSKPFIALYSILGTAAVCHYDLIQKFLPWGK